MHATSFPPKPQRSVVMRVHGTHGRPTVVLPTLIRSTHVDDAAPVDLRAHARLAAVLSVVAVIVAVGLHGIVPGPAIALGMTAVSGVVAWRRITPTPRRGTAADIVRH
ncbi:MAG: hypothetical protein ACO3S5_05960 [Ilumatobacteraceae bacterium]|jgi:hypothetical protein